MLIESWSGIAGTTAATTTVNLRNVAPNSGNEVDGQVWNIADFDIEVLGNDAEVTLKAKGPHSSSIALDVTGGSFAINGGKVSARGFNFAELQFTTSGSAYTINITRQIAAF